MVVNDFETEVHKHQSDHMTELTAAIIASVIKTTWPPACSTSTTFSRPCANIYCRSCLDACYHTLDTSQSESTFALSPSVHQKQITEHVPYVMLSMAILP